MSDFHNPKKLHLVALVLLLGACAKGISNDNTSGTDGLIIGSGCSGTSCISTQNTNVDLMLGSVNLNGSADATPSWLGTFVNYDPTSLWLYQSELGWLYVDPTSTPQSVYLYSMTLGSWVWTRGPYDNDGNVLPASGTSSNAVFPHVYHNALGRWMLLNRDPSNPSRPDKEDALWMYAFKIGSNSNDPGWLNWEGPDAIYNCKHNGVGGANDTQNSGQCAINANFAYDKTAVYFNQLNPLPSVWFYLASYDSSGNLSATPSTINLTSGSSAVFMAQAAHRAASPITLNRSTAPTGIPTARYESAAQHSTFTPALPAGSHH